MKKDNNYWIPPLTVCLMWLLFLPVVQAADKEASFNRINFNVTASRQVAQDILVATLSVQHQDKDSSVAADHVNQTMQWAINQAAKMADAKTQTLGYSTRPIYDKRKIRAWEVKQSLRIESENFTELTHLLATLQEQLDVSSMSYQLSKAQRSKIETELVNIAIDDFTQRAQQIQQQLSRKQYRIVQLNINTNNANYPVSYQRNAMMSDEMSFSKVAAPAVKAGESEISVAASGTIELSEN